MHLLQHDACNMPRTLWLFNSNISSTITLFHSEVGGAYNYVGDYSTIKPAAQ